jgi:hypothetical protein
MTYGDKHERWDITTTTGQGKNELAFERSREHSLRVGRRRRRRRRRQ